MVVLVIIGLLAGLVAVNVRGHLISGRQNAARIEIRKIVDALDSYYAIHNRYPTNDEGLSILTQPSEKFPEPLLGGDLLDPWGHPNQYNQPGREGPYEVISLGADQREGGAGADMDIVSYQLK